MSKPIETGPEPVLRSAAEDHEYWSRRAEQHRQLADSTAQTTSRNIHLRFQQLYEEQAALIATIFPD